jgi:3'(2'), 5'-bisphosphate nucleotidase
MNFHRDFFMIAIKAAFKAGEEILKIYETQFEVEEKNDGSPITIADRKSNEIIEYALSGTFLPVISEESEIPSYNTRKNWDHYWLVDPLDGTREFVNRNGEFTVNIAYMKKQLPVWGIIVAPVLQTIYFSTPEGKSYKIEDFKLFKEKNFADDYDLIIQHAKTINTSSSNNHMNTILGSKSHYDQQNTTILSGLIDNPKDLKVLHKGSSLKFCLLAEGLARYYPRVNKTWEWDTAAGHAILISAGGMMVSYPEKKDFLYNKNETINGGFIAFASKEEARLYTSQPSL